MSITRYLHRIGHRWYVRVKVPPSLQGRVGNTHIRRALNTRDLDEANRLKWEAVALIRAHLEQLRCPAAGDPAERLESPRIAPEAQAKPVLTITLPDRLTDAANRGHQKLDELVDRWLVGADYLEQTKQQHRQSYGELRKYMGADPKPGDVTTEIAVEFIEDHIKRSGKSYATKRRKLNSLIALWHWLGSRRDVPRGFNPWLGFRLGKKNAKKSKVLTKRPYSMDELVRLLTERPPYPGLADVVAMGLLTGARLEEICALRIGDVEKDGGVCFVSITKAKTQAGIRKIAVAHPIATALLSKRLEAASNAGAQLFPEFKGGGYDDKLSWAVSKAFGRFRDKAGLSRETDFHSFRRTFITLMENLSVDQVRIARYVGHELPTLAFAVYSGGSTAQTMRETAALVRYPDEVERAIERFIEPASGRRVP